jgi:hypothetical protein
MATEIAMDQVQQVAVQVLDYLRQVPQAAGFVDHWPDLKPSRAQTPVSLPVCAHLQNLLALGSPETAPLVAAIVGAAAALEWRQTYGPEDFGPEFLRGYGWSELIGLRGPIASDAVAMGVLLLGPGITYPPHAHQAEEIYIPLSGTALWQAGDAPFAPHPPGTVILHHSWQPHATTTVDQALLALYVWRGGDLAAKSQIVGRG